MWYPCCIGFWYVYLTIRKSGNVISESAPALAAPTQQRPQWSEGRTFRHDALGEALEGGDRHLTRGPILLAEVLQLAGRRHAAEGGF